MSHRVEKIFKKKSYLSWFLSSYRLKEEKTRQILEYILHNEEVLSRVNFVEDIRPFPNAILISTKDAMPISYLLRIEGRYFEDIEEFMKVLKSKGTLDLYVWVAFNREFICSHCTGLMQEISESSFSDNAKKQVAEIEENIIAIIKDKEEMKKNILSAIDDALINKDKEEFIRLTNHLKELE